MEPLLILADSYRLACDYAHAHDLGREGPRWRYIREARHAYGRSGPGRYVVLTVPGARLGPHAYAERAELLAYLRAHGFTCAP